MLSVDDFISIGKIVKPVGVKGNLKIIFLTDFPERFYDLKTVKLFCEKDNKFTVNRFTGSSDFDISECKVFDDYVRICFKDYTTIELTKELINTIVVIEEEKRVKLGKNSFYYYELVGCKVFDKGELIGEVTSIDNYGSGDLFNVLSKGKQFYIPYRNEFVKKIDIANSRIDVDLIDGFLE